MPSKSCGISSIAKLRLRCTNGQSSDPDICWQYTGAIRPNGQAAIWVIDRATKKGKVVTAPRAALMLSGKHVEPGWKCWAACGNPVCCNPRHARAGTYKEWGAWLAEQGILKTPRNQAASVARARKRSGLTPALLAIIRDDPRPATELENQLTDTKGRPISRHVIRRARRNPTCWEQSNPFAGLFTGLAANDSRKRAA